MSPHSVPGGYLTSSPPSLSFTHSRSHFRTSPHPSNFAPVVGLLAIHYRTQANKEPQLHRTEDTTAVWFISSPGRVSPYVTSAYLFYPLCSCHTRCSLYEMRSESIIAARISTFPAWLFWGRLQSIQLIAHIDRLIRPHLNLYSVSDNNTIPHRVLVVDHKRLPSTRGILGGFLVASAPSRLFIGPPY